MTTAPCSALLQSGNALVAQAQAVATQDFAAARALWRQAGVLFRQAHAADPEDHAAALRVGQALVAEAHALQKEGSDEAVGLWRDAAAQVHPDLQPLGYQVLVAIASGKATSATAIVDRLQTDKSAVSRHVRQLEDLGLVESRPDADDRRARVLAATDTARERLALARRRYQTRMGERLTHWSVDDLGRVSWQSQMEGGKAGRELPGIVDQHRGA